ncbi:methyltransferase domain-containing protein [Conexibacter sp. SYSU D00693]|uniref:methyltransferase domain-containing protein n=1 Tax=Conexibacter sp. SYSU D00693 TaxID=2812560 RepID=UPI00196AC5A0|nr:methyltransferase domain-containing protein [Conexibacter sp. SYSU D00693]
MHPCHVYDAALAAQRPLVARDRLGRTSRVPLARWVEDVDDVDRRVLATVRGPVLDLGCGPGRHLRALRAMGVAALGVDRSAGALRLVREAGLLVLEGDVLDPPPMAGAWGTVLLLDGNIGIGGDPLVVLRRAAEALAPGGLVVAELAAERGGVVVRPLRLEGDGHVGEWFCWATVGADALEELAGRAGLAVAGRRQDGGRWFAWLEQDR